MESFHQTRCFGFAPLEPCDSSSPAKWLGRKRSEEGARKNTRRPLIADYVAAILKKHISQRSRMCSALLFNAERQRFLLDWDHTRKSALTNGKPT